MRKRILGLPRNIFFLGLTSLFNDFSSEMVYAIFPAFFTGILGAGAASLGLVDEYHLMLFPVILGTGKRLFEETPEPRSLRLVSSTPMGSDGVLVLTYRPAAA